MHPITVFDKLGFDLGSSVGRDKSGGQVGNALGFCKIFQEIFPTKDVFWKFHIS